MKLSEIITKIRAKSHCNYVVVEAFYHLWGRENGFTPMCVKAHWFLEHRPSGFILDLMPRGTKLDFGGAVPSEFKINPSKPAQRVIASLRSSFV